MTKKNTWLRIEAKLVSSKRLTRLPSRRRGFTLSFCAISLVYQRNKKSLEVLGSQIRALSLALFYFRLIGLFFWPIDFPSLLFPLPHLLVLSNIFYSYIRSRTNDSGKRCTLYNIDVRHSKLMYSGLNWFMLFLLLVLLRITIIYLTRYWYIQVRNFVRKKPP